LTHFNWTPGIGDPSFGGWLTVVLYFLAAFSCWLTLYALSKNTAVADTEEIRAWWSMFLLLLALAVNKQLDLQTALTELGRVAADYQGWYNQRQQVQLGFIAVVAAMCATAAVLMIIWIRHSPVATWLAVIATVGILGFVLMRAASFHHLDRFIGERVLGLRWNWVLEMGGIIGVMFASEWRRRLAGRRQVAGNRFS
jgi:hypothetical protein